MSIEWEAFVTSRIISLQKRFVSGRKVRRFFFLFHTLLRKKIRKLIVSPGLVNYDTEWELNDSNFANIVENFGPFYVELFANASNSKCKKFGVLETRTGSDGRGRVHA